MKKSVLIFCLVLLGVITAFTSPVVAEDAKPAGLNVDELKKALGLSIYLQGGYTANLNNPDSGENDFRIFDHKANSFTLDLAEIIFAKDPASGSIGYKLKLSAGETAKFIHSTGLGVAGPTGEAFDVTEAYVSYLATVGKGLRFDFGKFVTYHGAEVIEAKDNPNYSRSFLFNYAIPFTHTGLKVSYAFSDALNASFHIVNGWDNSTDNNKGKTYGLSIGLTPAEVFSANVNLMSGPEQNNNNSNKRNLVDIVATIKPTKQLSLILNVDEAKEDNAHPSGDAKWSGIAGIVKYDFNDKYSLSVRAESFDDKDGFRTGTVQKLKEVTLTPEIRLAGGLILRPEYRHDSSDKQSFEVVSGAGTKKSQDTIALGVMYTW
jgi:hypothetical protein